MTDRSVRRDIENAIRREGPAQAKQSPRQETTLGCQIRYGNAPIEGDIVGNAIVGYEPDDARYLKTTNKPIEFICILGVVKSLGVSDPCCGVMSDIAASSDRMRPILNQ